MRSWCRAIRSARLISTVPKPLSAVPGPRAHQFLSNLFRNWKTRFAAGEEGISHKLSRQYGPIVRINLGEKVLLVSGPEAIEAVLRSEGPWPTRGSLEANITWIHKKNDMCEGMIFSSGAEWRRLRSALSKQIIPRRLEIFIPNFYAVSDVLCIHLANCRSETDVVDDVHDVMNKWALKGIASIVFKRDIDVFSGNNPDAVEFIKTSQDFIKSMNKVATPFPIYKIFPTKSYLFYVESVKKLHRIGRNFIQYHKEKASEEQQHCDDKAAGLLDQWHREGILTEEEAVSQACDQLGAGVDTTSNTATFLLHELAKHPDLQDEVRQEILEVMGHSSQLTSEHLQRMKLVRNCVRETLRLYPALPVTARVLAQDTTIHNYHIPAGTVVAINLFSSGRDPAYFPQPHKFSPHRWSSDKSHPFASIPFGFGPRMCYGRRIAELELYTMLVCVLQRFRLTTEQTSLDTILKTTVRPNELVKIRFTDC